MEDTESQIYKGCTESCILLEPVITPTTCAHFTSKCHETHTFILYYCC
jgi:hypothetical protein